MRTAAQMYENSDFLSSYSSFLVAVFEVKKKKKKKTISCFVLESVICRESVFFFFFEKIKDCSWVWSFILYE